MNLLKKWFNWCFADCNIVSVTQKSNGNNTTVVQVGSDVWINGVEIKTKEPVRSIKTVNGATWINGKRV